MQDANWILIDTETTGFKRPIYTVELAAQRMRGWEPEGKPFRRLLNHGVAIPAEASRVHGYTLEILERDGDPPEEVYEDFENYVEGLPVVAYNLSYDWDDVLVPEWGRLGIDAIGERGFCAFKLAQRLLDPVPAGNCKLQTLRQYYRLPERGAHTALGDVETVVDLMQLVLRPIAENRELDSWEKIRSCAEDEWFPSRIPFGKFKGRLIQEAADDPELMGWVEWLAASSNEKSARMGQWYLERLRSGDQAKVPVFLEPAPEDEAKSGPGLVIYQDPEVKHYQALIESSRVRLADLEAEFGVEKAKVDSIRAMLFEALRSLYEERGSLIRLIRYRTIYIDRLLLEGEESAEEAAGEYEEASREQEEQYSSTASELEGKKELNEEEKSKLKTLWHKLVKLFHPDRHENDPAKRKTFELLTGMINDAKERGDIDLLETIAKDPEAFILEQGWDYVSLGDPGGIEKVRSLYDHLQTRVLTLIETIDTLKQSPDYELFLFEKEKKGVIIEVIAGQKSDLEKELKALRAEAERKAKEIEELTGKAPGDMRVH